MINGNFKILKWRYSTIVLAIFWGDILLHSPYIGQTYMLGTSNKSVPEMAIEFVINPFVG